MQFDAGPLAAAVDAHFGHHHWAIESAVLHTTEQPNPNNPVYGLGEGQFSIQWIGTQAWDEGTGYPDPVDPTASQTGDGITYNISRSLDLTGPVLGTFANTGPNTTQKFVDLICDLGALPPGLADDLRDGELMSLYLTPADADIGLQFAARDNKTEERRPYLAVEAVEQQAVIPEPATATLLAIGLLAGAGRLRRRRP